MVAARVLAPEDPGLYRNQGFPVFDCGVYRSIRSLVKFRSACRGLYRGELFHDGSCGGGGGNILDRMRGIAHTLVRGGGVIHPRSGVAASADRSDVRS